MYIFTDLSRILDHWLRRLRIQRLVTWLQRGLAIGLASGFTVGILGLLTARLLRQEFILVVLACAFVGALLAASIAYAWPIRLLQAARRFDRLFLLDERVSTAWELGTSAPRSGRLVQQQLDDAVTSAARIEPVKALPLRFMRLEALLALLFVVLGALVLARGQEWFQAAQQARQVQQAVQAQSEKIEQIIQDVQANLVLTEEQKQQLAKPLEQALQGLQADPSQEGSVSVMSSTSEKLQALSDPHALQTSQALQQAGKELSAQEGSPLESVGQQLAQGNAMNAAAELKNIDVSQLSQAGKQQLAQQLQSLADSMAASNPALSADLENAAQALQNGDAQAAQQALEQASKSLAQTGQQLVYSQVASEAAQQMQQGAGQVLAAGGGQPGSQTAGQPGSSSQPGGTNNSSSGSGRGSSNQDSGAGAEAGSQPIPHDNGPGDGGESAYEPIYAPSLIGGDQGPSVNLPSAGQDGTVLSQGPTTPSDPGQSLVPYSQVYPQYDQINQQAIENGSVPLEFLQIIRDYFDSLEP